jgi:hypothetical protein
MCVLLYLMYVVIIHSTARLSLSSNSLSGTIPSQIALLTNLSELSIVQVLVMTIVFLCVSLNSMFFIIL